MIFAVDWVLHIISVCLPFARVFVCLFHCLSVRLRFLGSVFVCLTWYLSKIQGTEIQQAVHPQKGCLTEAYEYIPPCQTLER